MSTTRDNPDQVARASRSPGTEARAVSAGGLVGGASITPAQAAVLSLQRTAGNRAVARLLGTRAVSGGTTRTRTALLQRDVGFEFQTGWGIKRTGQGDRPFRRQEVIADRDQFKVTADEATGRIREDEERVGAEIEFVVPHVAEDQRNEMDVALAALFYFAAGMNVYKDYRSFTLDAVSGDPAHSAVEVHPMMKRKGDLQANPQTTGGVRLRRLTQMFTELGTPQGPHADAQSLLVNTGGGPSLASAAAAVAKMKFNGRPASDQLKGLAAMIITYLRMGMTSATAEPGVNKPPLNYAKANLTLLARTDFSGMYQHLPDRERKYFSAHPETFREMILKAAAFDPAAGALSADANVLERGVQDPKRPSAVKSVAVTRRAWIEGIPAGRDLLKAQTDRLLFGFGSLGSHSDRVGAQQRHRAAILEFRTMGRDVSYKEWRPLGMKVFDYIAALNQ